MGPASESSIRWRACRWPSGLIGARASASWSSAWSRGAAPRSRQGSPVTIGLSWPAVPVSIGEAVLTPAAVSLIADMFAPDRRTLPTSLYTAVASLMGVGAFAVGGAAVDLATRLSPVVGLEPWRLTLVLVGAPGLLLAAILAFTGREPDRRED